VAKGVTKQLPEPIRDATAKIDEYARGMISGTGSTLFEELGLYYIGPIDGHNMTGAGDCSFLMLVTILLDNVNRTLHWIFFRHHKEGFTGELRRSNVGSRTVGCISACAGDQGNFGQ
jgi:hypothetical protein